MLNRVFLIGNLTRDPETRYMPSGSPVTTFDIAVNERYRDRNQELREETLFIRIETFARQAETCAQYLKKGSRVLVEGKLREDKWEAKDGTKRSRFVLRGINVQFLDTRSAEGGTGASDRTAQPAPQAAQPAPSTPPAESAPMDAPPSDGIPEVDINDQPFGDEGENPSTNDDLPF